MMKNAILFALLLSSWLYGMNQVPFKENLYASCSGKCRHETSIKSLTSFAGSSYDIYYHRLEWAIDPNVRYISGCVTTYFTAKKNLNSLNFDCSDTLIIDSIIHQTTPIGFSLAGDSLHLIFPSTIPENSRDSVSVYYHGIPRASDTRSFVQSVHDTLNTLVPVIWTLSEPYGSKEWWPCKQSLNDKIDSVDTYVVTPNIYRAAGIGLLVSEKADSIQRISHWKHRYPVAAYLIPVAVTNFAVHTHYAPIGGGDSVIVMNYFYPEDSSFVLKAGKVEPIMELYGELFCPYPFRNEKYGHTQFGWGGGMEHQTMSFMYYLEHELTAHELAHQWFGDYITCASWKDIWLNEGFAEYLTILTYEHMFDGYWWPVARRKAVQYITTEPDGSVFVADTLDVSRTFNYRLTYKKGAMLLHMLRWELGDSLFFGGVRTYLNDLSSAYGYATTDQFKHKMEFYADTTLDEYFDDWFFGEGYPVYYIEWSQDSIGKLHLYVEQSQTHPSVDFFEMTLPIVVYGEGTDTVLRLTNRLQGQNYYATPGFVIDSLKLDPEYWIITKDAVINSVSEVITSAWIRIYPNPAHNFVQIEVIQEHSLPEMSIIDIRGNTVSNWVSLSKGVNKISFQHLKPGVYFISVRSTTGSFVSKLVVTD